MNFTRADEAAEIGRRLGHDLFRYGRPAVNRRLPPYVCEGLMAASSTGLSHLVADRFVRKWLQLRLSAFARGRAFDEKVTPQLLREIDVPTCPVLRVSLTHGQLKDTDWSVDRLNNDGAYAANNLAVMSTRANLAKGSRSFADVHALALQNERVDGLEPVEWLRLAALMMGPCFAGRASEAPVIPMVARLAPRSVGTAMQLVQHVLATRAKTQAGKNELIKALSGASSHEISKLRLRELAEAVHQGLKSVEFECDVWLEARAMTALLAWRATLDTNALGLTTEIARLRNGGSRVAPQKLKSWRLAARGYGL